MVHVYSISIAIASVDEISLLHETVPADHDLRLSGFVSFVGASSMEVSIFVEAVPEGYKAAMDTINTARKSPDWSTLIIKERNHLKETTILKAKFLMVARDPQKDCAAIVNSLRLDSEYERKLFREGAGSFFP